MKNLTPELIEKAKAAKSAEELLALAKENGVELTEEEAKTYFEQIGASGAVSDDDLDAVSGGWDCPGGDDTSDSKTGFTLGDKVKVIDGNTCSQCGGVTGVISSYANGAGNSGGVLYVKCTRCGTCIIKRPTNSQVEVH